mmetsp:Transcript_57657/g.65793  ORF Transcript_57657/g.65793 Transcript_57657/m.65793 type:complete len:225 (+) Transcript_57657:226-900(+)
MCLSSSGHSSSGHSHATSTGHASATTASATLLLFIGGVLNSFINRQNNAASLSSSSQSVDLHHTRFPNETLISVTDVLTVQINTEPTTFGTLGVLLSQLVHNIVGVKSTIFGNSSGDDLQGLSVRIDDQMEFATQTGGIVSQVSTQFHFDGTSSSNNRGGVEGSSDNHDGIIQRSFSFVNELFSSPSQNDSGSFGGRTVLEQVISFGTDLFLFEVTASSQNFVI